MAGVLYLFHPKMQVWRINEVCIAHMAFTISRTAIICRVQFVLIKKRGIALSYLEPVGEEGPV